MSDVKYQISDIKYYNTTTCGINRSKCQMKYSINYILFPSSVSRLPSPFFSSLFFFKYERETQSSPSLFLSELPFEKAV